MTDIFAPYTLPLRREGDAAIVDAAGETVLVIDPDRHLEDDQATAIADYVFALSAPAAPQAAGVGERERPLCVITFREGKREPELISWDRMPVGEHWLYSEAQNLGFLIDTDDGTEWVDEDPRRCGIPEHFENVRPLTLQVAKDEMLSAWEVRSELEAALRAPSREPEGGARRFRHWARGTIYTEVGEARLQQSGQFGPCEGDAITVYRGEDGQLWARASSEFHDGRFEELPTLATHEEAPAEAGEVECDGCDGDRCVYVGSLCNPSAQPPAREDAQPVAWRRRAPSNLYWTLFDNPKDAQFYLNCDADGRYTVQPLYTHPAPDALRAAVEELGRVLDAVDEPAPKPLPEQPSRAAEAMAGKADDEARSRWEKRVYAAKNDLVFKVRQVLAALQGAK
ncbi:hypothetical protein [Brevundimonas sp.]|uniref:hypothetical protein n=1 Tax=Brevundimonas sp. TaxID=1871086 RepID=UPI00289D6F63|nr:hypothetical protein [Brevundimonas sp.]